MTQLDSREEVSNSTTQWCSNNRDKGKAKEGSAVQTFTVFESNSQSRCPVKGSSKDDSIKSSVSLRTDVTNIYYRLRSVTECIER